MTIIHLIPDTHVILEACDDGLLVVDIDQSNYVFLDPVGAHMWLALRDHPDVADAAAHLSEIYEANITQLRTDVAEFGAYLISIGLADGQPWVTPPPVEPPPRVNLAPQDLYLDLLIDTLVAGVDAAEPDREAHMCRVVKDLTASVVADRDEGGAVALPATLGTAVALTTSGALAAHGQGRSGLWIIPDSEDTPAPAELISLSSRLRLDPLWTWGWPDADDVEYTPPALVWVPPRVDAESKWADLALHVRDDGIVVTDDVASDLSQELLRAHSLNVEDVTPLSWSAGWWRVPPSHHWRD